MKYAYIALGLLFLGIGAIGAIAPIPTTPFVILAAICFGRSSKRLHARFVSTKFYRNNLESLIGKKTMTFKAKRKMLLMITSAMALSFFTMLILSAPLFSLITLAVVWVAHMLYFGFWIKSTKD